MISPTKLGIVFLSSIVMAGMCFAQSGHEEPKYFHLDFVLKELESGKVIDVRTYSTTVSTQDPSGGFNIRTGNKVPAWTGAAGAAPTYIDVGVNIDCRPGSVKVLQDQLALYITAEISSLPAEPHSSATLPLIRQTKWSSNVIVSLRKPTTIFSSDDPTTKRQMQLELTAVPIR